MKNIQLIGLVFIMLSCNTSGKQVPKSVNYDLKENVKFLSEKIFSVVYDEYENLVLDTASSYFITTIINRNFDKKGNINSTRYFNKDSVLVTTVKYYKNETIQFDKNGNKQDVSKIILVQSGIQYENGILYVESYNPSTQELLQKAWTKYDNERILWQKSIQIKDSLYIEYVYCRNNDGLDTLIKSKFGFEHEISEDYHLINIKYLSFDEKGNWTKRLEYSLDETNNYCYMVRQRKIEYYE